MEHGFVEVRFLAGYNNSKPYYFKNGHEGIEIGDTVVVDTRSGLQVALVLDKPETVQRNVGRWVAAKIDTSRFEEIEAIREKEKATKARKHQLKQELKRQFENEVMPKLLEKYAEEDEELAKMLEEFKSL